MTLQTMPDWLTTALVGAVLATLGFVAKQLFEWAAAVQKDRRERRARLVSLLALLNDSSSLFGAQVALRNRLDASLATRDAGPRDPLGYEAAFAAAYPTMTNPQRELHQVIRGYTVHGLKLVNDAVLAWLTADTEFKLDDVKAAPRAKLARELRALEAHLVMWRAKYGAWIPDTPSHALVYLGDEESHGAPFPTGIEHTIVHVLALRRLGG